MANIQDLICRERDAGKVTCALYKDKEVLPRRQRFEVLGFKDLSESQWTIISFEEACVIATACLHRDLAYESEIMAPARARDLALKFLSQLPDGCIYRTNGNGYELNLSVSTRDNGWYGISDSTFDAGVVAEKNGLVGILWVEDED